MVLYQDQLGRELKFEEEPRRIVSLVPSITELVVDLAGRDRLVGCTAWCVHPAGLKEEKVIIGGTKNIDLSKIRGLKPDLIIANKEENILDQVEQLWEEFPVYVSEVNSLDDSLQLIKDLGLILKESSKAQSLLDAIQKGRTSLASRPKSFLYFIWKDPYMVAGPETYISSLFEEIGWKNLAPKSEARYPILSLEEIKALGPESILLSSEPYAFKSSDTLVFLESDLNSKIVDGERFSWYGPRLLKALKTLNKMH